MERLFDILSTCVTNSQYLSRANEILKEFENSKGYGPALLVILNASSAVSVSTLAGILLKNLITDH
jgi:Importin-beta N-terminal domain.